MATVNFTGLASGLDTRALIDAILNVERKPVQRLQSRQQLYSQRRSALDELRSKLKSFEGALRDLSSARTFRGRTASLSDESILRATAGSGTETGIFSIEVTALAAAHKVKSDALISPDQGLVADGTITIQSGARDAITIDVSATSGNNTLQAVRDAINAAGAGVRAAIVFDGTDYILSVRSADTGTTNALAITDTTNLNLAAAGNVVTAAADATLTVDGIAVSSASNKIGNVIEGVTLDLLTTTTGGPITLELAQNVDGVVEATQKLVSEYNGLIGFFNTQTGRDNPGPLAGDPTLRGVHQRIARLFSSGIEGLPVGGIRSLSAVGVGFDGRTGEATLDTSKLRGLLATRFAEVGNLFLSSGRPSDPRVQYVGSTSRTLAGDYTVEVTQAAEQATVSGQTALTALGQAETLTISAGGASATIDLTAGQNLTQVIDAINAGLRAQGVAATALSEGGRLRIASRDFGASATIDVASSRNDPGDGTGTGFSTTSATDTGLDVAGRIGGIDATGNGQFLSAADDQPFSDLVLKITANAADVTTTGGNFGTVAFSQGLLSALIGQAASITRSGNGELDVARESLSDTIKRMTDDIARIEERLQLREARLLRQFAAAERAISALQAQQSRLGGALGG